MKHYLPRFLLCSAAAVCLATQARGQTSTDSNLPEMLVLSSSEDAGGTKQEELGPEVLKMLERRSVEMLEAKTRAYLKSQGQPTQLPKFQSDAHYMQAGGTKLAIVRIRVPKTVNQVFVYGIRGTEFHRVACARTTKFEESIPLFYGPCSERIREVFGISITPR